MIGGIDNFNKTSPTAVRASVPQNSIGTVTQLIIYPGQFSHIRVELDHSRTLILADTSKGMSVNGKKFTSVKELLANLDLMKRIAVKMDKESIDFSQETAANVQSADAENDS